MVYPIQFVWLEGRSLPLVYCGGEGSPTIEREKESIRRRDRFPSAPQRSWKEHRKLQYR